ncbi:MAG TPA: FAD-dependent oxidoreductase [Methyloceanibacter sp.]|nr:FAD-dependent oxidoreductase [Methyloceanibacter sp.]
MVPLEDEEVAKELRRVFTRKGIDCYTSARLESAKTTDAGVEATFVADNGERKTITAAKLLMATGRAPNTAGIGLETVGVAMERGYIKIDRYMQTNVPGIYAIGDVVGPPWLAHKASHEGIICVEKIAGLKGVHPLDKTAIPSCTYSSPQVASVGLTEAQARQAGHELKIGRFPYSANGKAIALGEAEGLVKTIFDAKTGALLGAHILGAEATELIQGFVIGKTLETTEAELIAAIFPHPTLSEMMGESVLDAYGRALHI